MATPVEAPVAVPVAAPVAAPISGGLLEGGYIFNSDLSLTLVQIIIILGLSRLLTLAIRYIREPAVIAEILAGIILGPTVLGRIPGFTDTIFPKSSIALLSIIANIGLVIFMFVVGMETDVSMLRHQAKAGIITALFGILSPFVFTVPLIFLFNDPQFIPEGISEGVLFLFLGVVVAISALPVLARMLSEYHYLDKPLGVFIMTAASVDDFVAWPLLALAVALAQSTGGLSILYIVICLGGIIVLILFPVRFLFKFVHKRTKYNEKLPQVALLVCLLTLFIIAWISEVVGLTALIGAFGVGLVIPHNSNLPAQITERIEDLITVIFLPIYFTISGLKTQFGLIDSGILWGEVILLVFVAFFSKALGGALPARYIAKFSWTEASIYGTLMSTKGLVALVSLNLGLSANIITDRFFAMLIMMVLLNTMIPGPLLALIYRIAKSRGESMEELQTAKSAKAPIYKVMACLDNHMYAPMIVSLAASLNIERNMKFSRLYVTRLMETDDNRPSELIASYESPINKIHKTKDPVIVAAVQRAKLLKENISEVVTYVSSDIFGDIIKEAKNRSIDLLFLGCRHRRMNSKGITRVIQNSPTDIALVVNKHQTSGLSASGVILFVWQGTEHDEFALDISLRMLEGLHSMKMVVLHVEDKASAHNPRNLFKTILKKEALDFKAVEKKSTVANAVVEELHENVYSLVIIGYDKKLSKAIVKRFPELPLLALYSRHSALHKSGEMKETHDKETLVVEQEHFDQIVFNSVATVAAMRELTDSGFYLSLVFIMRLLPPMLWFPVAGVIADNFDKAKVMMMTNIIRAVVVLGYIIVIYTHQIWLLLLLIAIQESMSAFYWPCKTGLLPLYVPKEHIVIANSLDSTTWSSMYILGSAIGGFFLAWFGMTLNYIIDSVTYLISLFFVWRLSTLPRLIPTPSEIEMEDDEHEIANALADEDNEEQLMSTETNGGIDIEVYSITKRPPWLQALVDHFRSLRDGFLYLGRHKYLLALTMIKGTSSLVWGAVEFANILFSEDAGSYFGSLGQALGIVWAVSGVGSIIGPLFSGMLIGSNLRRIHWLIGICYIIRFFAVLLLAWSPNFIVILIATLLISVCGTTVWMFSSSLIQQVSAKQFLGRVSSCDITVYNFSMLVAYLLVGALFETFNLPIRACLLVFSGLALFGAIWTTVYFICLTNSREVAARYKVFEDSRSNDQDVFTNSTESSNQIQLDSSESDIEL